MTEQEMRIAEIKDELRAAFKKALEDVKKVTGMPVQDVSITFNMDNRIGIPAYVMVDKIDFEFRL